MGLNRKQRIRAHRCSFAFAHGIEVIYQRNDAGKILTDHTGGPLVLSTFKVPITAELSWIRDNIQHSNNPRREGERISTFRRKVYGAPLRILHNKQSYQESIQGHTLAVGN